MKDVLVEDFQAIVQSNIPFDKLKNKTFLVTGATGLVLSLIHI